MCVCVCVCVFVAVVYVCVCVFVFVCVFLYVCMSDGKNQPKIMLITGKKKKNIIFFLFCS